MNKKKLMYSRNDVLLSIQHLFAMFGATVLVPLLTGLDPSTALVTAGIGTLVFHFLTKMKVPVFLGSSFAFIPCIATVIATEGIAYAQGGLMIAGLVYGALALVIYVIGVDKIKKLLPPIVTGPIIIVIGIGLSGVAVADANGLNMGIAPTNALSLACWGIAFFTIVVVIASMMFLKGFFKLVPILIGLTSGYLLCVLLWAFGWKDIMSFDAISNAAWLNIPYGNMFDISDKTNGVLGGIFSLPKFSIAAIIAIAPVALVTFMEHIGDITTNSMVCSKDFTRDPGLHRTMLGDGLATAIAGFFGGPANTTYSENTGVLATTKNYNPAILRLAAVWAIILGFIGKFGGVLQTIPAPVKGGVEIILFGMIAAIGIRTLLEAKLDFTKPRNLIIVGLILVTGIGMGVAGGIMVGDVEISGLFVATVVGVVANLVLPHEDNADASENAADAKVDNEAEAINENEVSDAKSEFVSE